MGTTRLSLGASGLAKGFAVVVGLMGLGISAGFVAVSWLASGLLDSIAGHTDDLGPTAPGDPGVAIVGGTAQVTPYLRIGGLVCALPVALSFLYVIVRVLRSSAWLDGTTVVKRAALTTRRVDLATAEVKGDAVTHSQTHGNRRYVYTVAAVAARDPRTGTTVKIPLRGQGLTRLPAPELTALAYSIMAVRRPGDPGYQSAAGVADSLLAMAASPFPV